MRVRVYLHLSIGPCVSPVCVAACRRDREEAERHGEQEAARYGRLLRQRRAGERDHSSFNCILGRTRHKFLSENLIVVIINGVDPYLGFEMMMNVFLIEMYDYGNILLCNML